jgi:hypothetical protein
MSALARREIPITSMDDLARISRLVVQSGLAPSHVKTPAQAAAIIAAGLELGLPTWIALRGLQLVQGKVTLTYDAQVMLLSMHGYEVEWPEEDSLPTKDTDGCTVRITRKASGKSYEFRYTVAHAKKAKLWGKSGPWSDHPHVMLKARCITQAARAFAADAFAGVYSEDEGEEIRRNSIAPARVEVTRDERRLPEQFEAELAEFEELPRYDPEMVRDDVKALADIFKTVRTKEEMSAAISEEKALNASQPFDKHALEYLADHKRAAQDNVKKFATKESEKAA